jgi:branched-chain amino acid transport system permease protein
MIEFLSSYGPLLDIFLLNCGFAFSQYIALRAGIFSVATAGFAGLGAYTAGILAVKFGFGLLPSLAMATLVGLAAGVILAIPLARLRGAYQAIATLAFVQIVVAVLLNAESITGGAMGFNDIPRLVGPWTLLFWVAVVTYLMISLSVTRIGRAFDLIRQDEVLAASLGTPVAAYHILGFALSGAIAGLFGGLQAFYIFSIEPNQYGFPFLTAALAFVVLGGRKSVAGPLIGAAILTILPELVRPLAENRLLLNGALLMLAMAFLPHGIADGLILRYRKRRIARREPASKELADGASSA